MKLPKFVKIVEVGPRDGLQNEKIIVPTDIKIKLINELSKTGLSTIEVTSFVSHKKIPQLKDASIVYKSINKNPNVNYPVLIPNEKGLELAIDSGIKDIAIFTSVSESFCKNNINCSIEESFSRMKTIAKKALKSNLSLRGYLSCTLGCPYEGKIETKKVTEIAKKLFDLGCYEISLGDTIGIGTPLTATNLIIDVSKEINIENIAIHFHDTYGKALENILACLKLGIKTVDSSIAGLGGCPFAKIKAGNVSTESLINMLHNLDIKTNIDLSKIKKISKFISNILKKYYSLQKDNTLSKN